MKYLKLSKNTDIITATADFFLIQIEILKKNLKGDDVLVSNVTQLKRHLCQFHITLFNIL